VSRMNLSVNHVTFKEFRTFFKPYDIYLFQLIPQDLKFDPAKNPPCYANNSEDSVSPNYLFIKFTESTNIFTNTN